MHRGVESLKVHQQAVPAPKPWFIQVIKFSCQKIRKQGSAEKSVLQSVFLTQRVHPYPFRTRKLSSAVPKILAWRRVGKIGHSRHKLGIPRVSLIQYSSIAQSVEHLTVNQGVTGSSPVGGAKKAKAPQPRCFCFFRFLI